MNDWLIINLQEPEAVSDDDDGDEGDDTVLGETRSEESESEEGDESDFEPLAKRPCSTRSGRPASSVQQHIFISFSFSGKKWLPPHA